MSFTKAMLLKMSKNELVGLAMSVMTKNEQITKSVVEELETMKGKLEAIESLFLISANANSLLTDRIEAGGGKCPPKCLSTSPPTHLPKLHEHTTGYKE